MPSNSMLKSNSFASSSKILLVEPDKTNRSLLASLIEELRPERFMIAKSLAEARSAMSDRVEQFDCVILGVKNPPTSGFHFLQDIRIGGVPRTPRNTRVILVSPPPNRAMLTLAKALDLDGFIAIPVTVSSVNNTLSAALKRQREAQEPGVYADVKLPQPVKKKLPVEQKHATPNAKVVWSAKEKEKAELIRSLKDGVAADASAPPVQPAQIDNIRSFWLKDLLPGMVLAEEIQGENKELLLATGTVLNDSLIEKIKKFSELGICRSFLKAGSAPE
ncbi:MAG: response regulator [Rhodospirillaceae bacterium]